MIQLSFARCVNKSVEIFTSFLSDVPIVIRKIGLLVEALKTRPGPRTRHFLLYNVTLLGLSGLLVQAGSTRFFYADNDCSWPRFFVLFLLVPRHPSRMSYTIERNANNLRLSRYSLKDVL